MATTPPSSCHTSSFIRTQSDPPNAVYSSTRREIQTLKCKHCQCVDQYKSRFNAIIKSLVNSCQEVTGAIRSRFQEDSCICYPNVIDERDVGLLERSEYFTIGLSPALRDELLQHVLRIVRPGASEHERNAPNSRLIRHTAASKILIPVTVNLETAQAMQVGFPKCHGFPSQANSVNLQVIDVVIDYDPPSELLPPTTTPLLFRTPTGYNRTPSTPHPLWDLTSQPSCFQFESGCLTYPQQSSSITELSMSTSPAEELVVSQESEDSLRAVEDFSLTEPTFPFDCDCVRPLRQLIPNKKIVVVGQYSTRGRRLKMEDRIVVIEDVQKHFFRPPLPNGEKVSFFSVFDGHGGTDVVDFVSKQLPLCFVESSGYAVGDYVKALYEAFERVEKLVVMKLNELLALTYHYEETMETDELKVECDQDFQSLSQEDNKEESDISCDELTARIHELKAKLSKQPSSRTPELIRTDRIEEERQTTPEKEQKLSSKDESTLTSGSTALIVVIVGNRLFVANLGDSRCILSRGGHITCLTEDHRLRSSTRELKRVEQTPGTYSYDGYLCGQLGVSRAFGNIYCSLGKKLLGLSSYPDVIHFELQADDEFLVAGCDGVFDTMAASDVAIVVKKVLQTHNDPCLAAKKLVELALINHAEDNVSAIVMWLRNEMASSETLTNTRLLSTSSFFYTGTLVQKQRGLSRVAKSTPLIIPQNLNQRLSLLDSSMITSASCNQCTCKELNEAHPNNANISPHPIAKVNSQCPAIRKRYCWNVVHTP